MKTILLFGDSNTWGFTPITAERYDAHTRWGGVCRDVLGSGYHVIEEGLGGRTTTFDDPVEGGETRNGLKYLIPCLDSHRPLDLVAIMLGTNNLKQRFALSASDIALSAGRLVDAVLMSGAGPNGHAPHMLLICPPPVAPLAGTPFELMFEGAEAKSRQLSAHYQQIAALKGINFFDAGSVVTSSRLDAIHLDADQQITLGGSVALVIRKILEG
ncbi:hydrolase [Anaerolineae bacterium CFX9]|jgi:lysophospholipase L1-like esterase|nr:hydrolase [Anaerolineae bacterium CFX9]